MIHRLPAIGISAFSAIIVAMPIAMLLNSFTVDSDATVELKSSSAPIDRPLTPTPKSPDVPTDDGGEPVVEEAVEKTE